MTDGRTAGEVKAASQSSEAIALLWQAIAARLKEGSRRHGKAARPPEHHRHPTGAGEVAHA
jgi:hypothetical protein